MQEATETPGSHLETEQAALLAVYSAARRWQMCLQQTLSADNLLAGQPKDVTVDDYHRRSHSTDTPVVSFRDTYHRRLGNKLPYEPTRPAGFVRPEFAGQAVPTVWHMSHECGTMWMDCQTNLKMQPSAGGVATQTRTVPDRKPPTSSLHPRLLHRTSELCVLTQSCQLPFGHA
ncbi:hypothetical protein ACCO45_013430 [Purpureocillium lilacinum]|uniref:Uncharacterized protein n=1 Tax=Purpureocillium lilacinum TaxID=33203 RepID=A0ACC4D8Y7_PURLI